MAPWWKNQRGEWFVIIQGVLFALVVFGPKTAPGLPAWSGRWAAGLALTGVALVIAGGLLSSSAVFRLGSNLSALPHPVEGAKLVASGPYRFVRHPIYAGIILAALGWGLVNRSTLGVLYALVLFIFFDIKSRREEFWMRQKLANYGNYQARVRKLIPFIY
ncbi:MAG: isoprenylcysteine carboxylmethyltransferase family protein [Anaerolineae bacterium]